MAANKKTPETILPAAEIEKLKEASIAKQFERDAQVIQAYLDDTNKGNLPLSLQSRQSREILKRLCMVLCAGDLQYRSKESNEFKSITEANSKIEKEKEKFTVAAALSHGGRIMLTVPKLQAGQDDPNKFLHFILGKKAIAKNSAERNPTESPVYQREAATHSIDSNMQERLLRPYNPTHWSRFASDYKNDRHFGMDLGLLSPDERGPEDGSHGHLYMYWKPPTKTEEGAFMFGLEGSAPGKEDLFGNHHGMRGKSPMHSPTGGLKMWTTAFKGYSIRPNNVNGLRMKVTKEIMNKLDSPDALTQFQITDIGKPIGHDKIQSENKQNKTQQDKTQIPAPAANTTKKQSPQKAKFLKLANTINVLKNVIDNSKKVIRKKANWQPKNDAKITEQKDNESKEKSKLNSNKSKNHI